MDESTFKHIKNIIHSSYSHSQAYASYNDWPEKQQQEIGAVLCLFESLEKQHQLQHLNLLPRGEGNDPPDCEAVDENHQRIGIEVTELVDEKTIRNQINGDPSNWADWDRQKLLHKIHERIFAKDKPRKVKGGPYDKYILLIHTEEPGLPFQKAGKLLANTSFDNMALLDEVYLIFSFDEKLDYCPFIELS